MFRYKAIGQNPQFLWRYEVGNLWAKPHMKSVKQNKRVMAKSRASHVENVGSRKWQHALNKHMLPFLNLSGD